MAGGILNLPINIPWKQIAVSPDMMDRNFCKDKDKNIPLYPYVWRSSLAISVYEPRPEDLPEDLCAGLTYLKITSTITGYQPSGDETEEATTILDSFPDEPTEDEKAAIERITDDYFACYGVLLNVAVFPLILKKELKKTIVKFTRELATPDSLLDNPYEIDGVEFEADDQPNNRVTAMNIGNNTEWVLDLFQKMIVTFIPSDLEVVKVETRVVHSSPGGVKMFAFKDGEPVGTNAAGLQQDVEHNLSIHAEEKGIDQVVFNAPENRASLIEFTYYVAEEVAIPHEQIDLEKYPHIIDFEPKTRDLYQAATESGEILTGSSSGVKTDKSFTHTESTENSSSFGVTGGIGGDITKKTGLGISGETKRAHKDTDQDTWSVSTDASRERRETQGTTTQLSQMYNLLTGYHAGTNRAAFLMLARPHTLQPTEYRTFVQGLRHIEGMQEFFLVVAHPKQLDGLCIDAFLETGHFPEDTAIERPPEEYEEYYLDYLVTVPSIDMLEILGFKLGILNTDRRFIEEYPSATRPIPSGWVVDTRISRRNINVIGSGWDDGHPGVTDMDKIQGPLPEGINYQTTDESLQVSGPLSALEEDVPFKRKFRVFLRREQPLPTHKQPHAKTEHLLITNRGLCVCYKSGKCPEVFPHEPDPIYVESRPPDKSIVDEPIIKINPALLTREALSQSSTPVAKAILKQIERSMTNSWRFPRRYPLGQVGFLESEYFKNRIKKALPNTHLKKPLSQVSGLPKEVIKALGDKTVVSKALEMDLTTFAKKSGLSIADAGKARRILLGMSPKLNDDDGVSPKQDQ